MQMVELSLLQATTQKNGMHLKLLNDKGEFISGEDGKMILDIAEKEAFNLHRLKNWEL